MPDDRTHAASPQKLARARARGDVAISPDLAAAAALGVLALWGSYAVPSAWGALSALARGALRGQPPGRTEWLALLQPLGPLFLALPIAAGLANLIQVGFPSGERAPAAQDGGVARPDLRAQRGADLSELALGMIKLLALGWLLLAALQGSLAGLMEARTAGAQLRALAAVTRELLTRAALGVAGLGVLDYLYRRWRWARRLRMSRYELQQEQRENEGDPRMRREARARGRALLQQATLGELDAASCVIASAGRAVALRYSDEMPAPVLWIKAGDELAEALLAHAGALGLPIEPDAALAQELFRLEPSEPIPAASYASVAAILRRGRA